MKKIFTLTVFALTCTLSQAQYNTSTGTVYDCMGNPVPGHAVYIAVDSSYGTPYWNTVYTDTNGVFVDSMIPYSSFLGGVQPFTVSTSDFSPGTAGSGWYYATDSVNSSGNVIVNDFYINCPVACAVNFYSWEDSTGVNDTTYINFWYTCNNPSTTTITWDFGDGSPLYTGTSPVHTYAVNGIYNVCVTLFDASDSCSASYCGNVSDVWRSGFIIAGHDMTGTITTGIAQTNKLENVKIYPNPAQGEVFVSGETNNVNSIVIYDIAGRPVSVTTKNSINTNTRLDISALENGSYIVVLLDNHNNPLYTHPMMKH